MQEEKRRRRIERIKTFLRILFFIKRNIKRGFILAGCLVFLSFAGYFSIQYVQASEEEKETHANTEAQTAGAESLYLSDIAEASGSGYWKNRQAGAYAAAIEEGGTEELTEEPVLEDSIESEKYAAPHKIDDPVHLSDIYAEKDSIVIFKSFYPDASGYMWEMYDAKRQKWTKIPEENIVRKKDELQRETSSFITTADAGNESLMIRCIIDFDTREAVTETAALHVLDKGITDIAIEDDVTVESGQYISVSDIPVRVTYEDGKQETIQGLNGIYFLETEESTEEATSVSGNLIETVTTINKAYEYTWADAEEKEMVIRYRNADMPLDTAFNLIGEDLSAPVITKLIISDFTVSSIDAAIPVKVTIQAEDDNTSYPDLQYAFLPDGREPAEDDWHRASSFDVSLTQNGKWMAYCKDMAGNIAAEEKEIIAVDNKAPYIVLQLETETEAWCGKNSIIVSASDALPVEYNYSCIETGEESGFIKENKKEVTENGTWKVQARDGAGNVAEAEITVSNIDKQPPVILEIKEVTEKRSYENED